MGCSRTGWVSQSTWHRFPAYLPTFPKHIKILEGLHQPLTWKNNIRERLTWPLVKMDEKNLQDFPREVLLDFRLQNSEESQSSLRFECMWFTLWALLVLLLVMVHITLCPRVCSVWKAAPLSGNHMWLEQSWARSKICLDQGNVCHISFSPGLRHVTSLADWARRVEFIFPFPLELGAGEDKAK